MKSIVIQQIVLNAVAVDCHRCHVTHVMAQVKDLVRCVMDQVKMIAFGVMEPVIITISKAHVPLVVVVATRAVL